MIGCVFPMLSRELSPEPPLYLRLYGCHETGFPATLPEWEPRDLWASDVYARYQVAISSGIAAGADPMPFGSGTGESSPLTASSTTPLAIFRTALYR